MSYDIYIGNAEVEPLECEDGEYFVRVFVPGHAEPDAPNFPYDITTKNGNSRHPGYSQWSNFCRQTGIEALFFDEQTGLLRCHPGCFALGAEHLATVRGAKERWIAAHPNAVPGWDYDPFWFKNADDGIRGRDGALARLLWLEWWIDWALRTCERPAMANR